MIFLLAFLAGVTTGNDNAAPVLLWAATILLLLRLRRATA